MTARDDLLERLVDARVRVIQADAAVAGVQNIKACCEQALADAQKELAAVSAEWAAVNPGWTEAHDAEVTELINAGGRSE